MSIKNPDAIKINPDAKTDLPDGVFASISETAMSQIQAIINQQDKEGLFLRLYVQGAVGGVSFGMALDTKKADDDHVCEVDGLEVVIDRISYPYLEGASVDFVTVDGKSGFQIDSPNKDMLAASACGSCSGDAGCC